MSSRTAGRCETRVEIMEATYHALRTHGYADLTIQDIADEFEKSKSLIYYHYDSKDALFVDFLDYLVDRFLEEVRTDEDADPDGQLRRLLDLMLPMEPSAEKSAFRVALLELRAQAPHNDDVRAQFAKSDAVLHDTIVDHLHAGIGAGVYRELDVELTAEFLHAAVNGAILREVTLGEHSANERVRAALDEYLDDRVVE